MARRPPGEDMSTRRWSSARRWIAKRPGWRWLKGRKEPADRLRPAEPFIALGDPHGCLAQVEAALDWARRRDPGARIVVLGDCVDRGPDSAGVLRRLFELSGRDPRLVCLMGNHDAMLLEFLASPETAGPAWARMGGRATLASFGVALPPAPATPEAYGPLAVRLRARMGEDLVAWITSWPQQWRSGNVAAAHAGLDPARPPEAQEAAAMLWGSRRFLSRPRKDGLVVVHGHYVVDAPAFRAGRIALDTGAYATGRLSAAHVAAGDLTFWTS